MKNRIEINGSVTGQVKFILRAEGFLVLLSSIFIYYTLEYSWKSFFILFFLPDISFAGYLLGSGLGSLAYNLLHSYILPIILGLITWYYQREVNYLVLIWVAHIGFDRFLGYGLKYESGFKFTHLGFIGSWGKKLK